MQYMTFVAARADTGAALPLARVSVYAAGTSTLAALKDANGGGIGNPFNADGCGVAGFAAADGLYDLSIQSADGAYTAPLVKSVQLLDLTAALAAVGSSASAAQAAAVAAANALATLQIAPLPPESGYAGFAFADAAGRVYLAFDQSGALIAKLTPASVSRAMLGADVQVGLLPTGLAVVNDVTPESGYVGLAIVDALQRILLAFDPTGAAVLKLSPLAIVPRAALSADVLAGLVPAGLTFTAGVAPESGYAIPFVDAVGRLYGGFTPAGTFLASIDPASTIPPAAVAAALLPAAVISWWGDSLTAGALGTPPSITTAAVLGRTVNNFGIGGQTSTTIAARQGGVPLTITGAVTIPASGGVTVTLSSDVGFNGGVHPATSWTGALAGVAGTLSMDTSGAYTFTRAAAGAATAAASGAAFVFDTAVARAGDTLVLWAGRNDGGAADTTIANTLAMIRFATAREKRVLVLSVLNGIGEGFGTAGYTSIMAQNAKMQAVFGGQLADIRSYLIKYGLIDAGIAATAFDTADTAADCVPSSLHPVVKTAALSGAVTAAATSFSVTAGTGALAAGDIVEIESERILIGAISGSSVTASTRGYLSTAAAAHASGAGFAVRDFVHLTTAAYAVIGNFVANQIIRRGW